MKYTHKDLPGSVKHLEVDLSQVEFSKYWETVHSEAVKEVEIKGFRKGTAPKEMASAALDKEKVFSEAATRAIRETLKEITQEKGWEIVDQPKINIEEKADGFIFKIDLVVFPEIKLGNYKKLAKQVFSEKTEVIGTDEEVKEAIDWILNSRAKLVRSINPAKMGDVVDIEYKGKPDQFVLGSSQIEECEHCAAEGNGSKEHKHDESNWIDKKIVGRKEGDEFDGIKLVSIMERQLPEMNDALAAELGKFKSVDEMKASIKEGIQKEKEIKENEKKRIILLEKIVKDSKLDIPQVMIEKTLAGMLEEYKAYFHPVKSSEAGATKSQFNGVKKDFKEEEVKEKLRPEAEKNIASNLVLYRIAKDEKVEPNAEEIEAESNKFLATLRPDMAAKIDPERVHNYSYDIVKNKKVFEFLEGIK
ncbi:MAG: trigger factor [bacterium]|nr:trigger factor [bacterium]